MSDQRYRERTLNFTTCRVVVLWYFYQLIILVRVGLSVRFLTCSTKHQDLKLLRRVPTSHVQFATMKKSFLFPTIKLLLYIETGIYSINNYYNIGYH